MICALAPERFAEAIVRLQQAGDTWHVPLFRAAMVGAIGFAIVAPGERIPARLLKFDRRPLVLVLGADGGINGAEQAGPDRFPGAWRAFTWARRIMLHGTGGEATHYGVAVAAATKTGRCLIVETDTARLPEWEALSKRHAARTPTLVVRTRPGAVHPLMTAPAGTVMQ